MDLANNLGNIIQIFVIVAGGIYFVWEMRTQLKLLRQSQDNIHDRLEKMDTEIENLAKVTIEMARQDERMAAMEQRVGDRLAAMDGRIQELSVRIHAFMNEMTPKKRSVK